MTQSDGLETISRVHAQPKRPVGTTIPVLSGYPNSISAHRQLLVRVDSRPMRIGFWTGVDGGQRQCRPGPPRRDVHPHA